MIDFFIRQSDYKRLPVSKMFDDISNQKIELKIKLITNQSFLDEITDYLSQNNVVVKIFEAVDCKVPNLTIDLSRCKKIDISVNQFQTITTQELKKCKKFHCQRNQLTQLPDLPKCQELICFRNNLTDLPELPECKLLRCFDNQLTNLPELPECKELECYDNQIVAIPDMPKCETIIATSNHLKQIGELPKCKSLECSDNQLVALPDLSKCEYLDCDDNFLQQLPQLPKARRVDVCNNELKSLGKINDKIETLIVINNRKYVLNCEKIQELNPSLKRFECTTPKSVQTPFSMGRPMSSKNVSLLTEDVDIPDVATPLQSMLRSKAQMSEYKDKREERVKTLVKVIKDLFEDYTDVKNENEEVARILLQRTFDKKMTVEAIKAVMKYLSDDDGQRLKKILKIIKEQVEEFEQYKQNPRIGGFSSDQGTISVSHLKRAMRK